MSGLDKIVQVAHENINEGKLYEALMQYKSLFNRFSRTSLEKGILIIQDGMNELSKQTDLNAYFGLIDFYIKFLEMKPNEIHEKSILPFKTLISVEETNEKIKYEENILKLMKNKNELSNLKNIFENDLGLSYMKNGNYNKTLQYFINDMNSIEMLFKFVNEKKDIKIEELYLITCLKMFLSSQPTNVRRLYKLVNEKYNEILNSNASQCGVLLTILIMKIIDKKDDLKEIEIAFDKIIKKYEELINRYNANGLIDSIKKLYFPSNNSNQNSNPFAHLMQMMGGN